MLALFSLLGPLFSLLAASCAFVGRFWFMLVVFFAFWVAPGPILERPGTILEVRNLIFRGFVARAGLQCENIAHVQKPPFVYVFAWFLHIASSVLKPKNDTKSFPKPFEQSSLQKLRKKRVLGWILEGSGALLAVSGPAFVHSWPAPGLSGVLLGRLLGTSGALLAASWPRWGASGPHFGSQERPKPRF